jgi:sugar lactone lactonase YvrE
VKRFLGALSVAGVLLATTFSGTVAAHGGSGDRTRSHSSDRQATGHHGFGHHGSGWTRAADAVQAKATVKPTATTTHAATTASASTHAKAADHPKSVAHHQQGRTIVLPGATSAEGLATGRGATFYAGDLGQGDIYKGNLRTGRVALFIDAPAGRNALGIKADVRDGLLFVAGGPTGQGYVYDLRTGADIAQFQFGTAGSSFVNDVVVVRGVAYFTDSQQPVLYRVSITGKRQVDTSFTTLDLTGPAANLTGGFNLNGIAASRSGRTLIVSHSADATLYTVNPATGESAPIAGANLPNVDGILFQAGRLWAVQNASNQVTELKLSSDLSTATVKRVYTNPAFETPTAIARSGNLLAVVNAKFDTGNPPTATQYEVVVFPRH